MAAAMMLEQRAASAPSASAEAWRSVQRQWASTPVGARVRVLRAVEGVLAGAAARLVDALPETLARTRADSYASEVLPLLAACRFLVRSAEAVLKPRRLGRKGLPFWLGGVETAVHRVPFGTVLVIGPANYPLFLPGVQTRQALAAGNAVVWKPGAGGRAVAEVFAAAVARAGLPAGLLRVTEESVAAAEEQIRAGVDKIVFTGSGAAGRAVLKLAAESATPVVAELSGCDAVMVLPSADRTLVLDALCFGMRLNGSATCMAPRRLLLVGAGHDRLLGELSARFAAMEGVALAPRTRDQVRALVRDAVAGGAMVCGDPEAARMKPVLVLQGRAEMHVAQADVFAPVLTVLQVRDVDEAVAVDGMCPFGLTAAVFGEAREAEALGERLEVGTVLVNDLIVPTADPRMSFGGRRGSGFGTTRGVEGLLEMTAVKTVAVRRSGGGKQASKRQYEPTGEAQEALFAGVAGMSYGGTMRDRVAGLRRMLAAAQRIKKDEAARERR